jgi:predicted  nucleic acid-binding Zn-ribbon protein
MIAKAKGEAEAARETLKKAILASDEKQLQLKSREIRIAELESKLNSAASNREFTLLKEQIAADKQANSVLSDEILEALEQIDRLEEEVRQADADLAQQQTDQAERSKQIETRMQELQGELARVNAELEQTEQAIPASARADYKRLTEAKGEEALAPVDGDSCGGCYQTLTTQLIDRLRMSMLIRCPNCNAFLYFPEDRQVR